MYRICMYFFIITVLIELQKNLKNFFVPVNVSYSALCTLKSSHLINVDIVEYSRSVIQDIQKIQEKTERLLL